MEQVESKGKIISLGRLGNEQFPQLIGNQARWIHEGALCPDDCRDVVCGGSKALVLEFLGSYFISKQGAIFQITFNFYMMSYGGV